jgi:hypothetical protein
VNERSIVELVSNEVSEDYNRNTFPTRAEAEAVIALAQLCQLRDIYNGEPLADWVDWNNREKKYCIAIVEDLISIGYRYTDNQIFVFKTEKIRDKFFYNFSDLLEKVKPLFGIKTKDEK